MKRERKRHVRLPVILLAAIAVVILIYVIAVNLIQSPVLVGTVIALAAAGLMLLLYVLLCRSLKNITETASHIAELDFTRKCRDPITEELAGLAETVNKLSGNLQSNVADLNETNRRLSQELAERKRQQQLTKDVISHLSHDLKTPIAIISGYAEALTVGLAKTDAQRDRYAGMISAESEHMRKIVEKLLTLSRAEANQAPAARTEFDFAALLRDILQRFEMEIHNEGLRLSTEIPGTVRVSSEPEGVEQIAINYIQNAIYHNSGTSLSVRLTRERGMARLSVINDAEPISEEDAPHIWEKLYRVDRARSRKHGEVGLGLNIVRQNCERLGLPYGFRNLDRAVEFYLEVPLADRAGNPILPQGASASIKSEGPSPQAVSSPENRRMP